MALVERHRERDGPHWLRLVPLLIVAACGSEIDNQLADAEAEVVEAGKELEDARASQRALNNRWKEQDARLRAAWEREKTASRRAQIDEARRRLKESGREDRLNAQKRVVKAQGRLKRAERRLDELRRLFPK